MAVAVPTIGACLLLLFTALEYSGKLRLESELRSRIDAQVTTGSRSIARLLWNYDIDSINAVLVAWQNDPDFLYAEVRDPDGTVLSHSGKDPEQSNSTFYQVSRPIVFSFDGSEEIIGTLLMAVGDKSLVAQVESRVRQDATIVLALLVVLTVVTWVSGTYIVAKPLRRLIDSVERVRASNDRRPVEWNSGDEFGRLVEAYNDMLVKQAKAESALQASEERARKSEAMLREAMEAMSDAVALFDDEGMLVLHNSKFSTNNPDGMELVSKGAGIDELRQAAIAQCRTQDTGRLEREFREMRASHAERGDPLELQLSDGRWILCSEHRTPSEGTVVVQTDITRLKKREGDLRLAMERADAASRAKSRFLANMSHELRTPLNAIIGFSEVIQSEIFGPVGNEKYRQYAEDIHSSGEHLLDLINDVLDLAKVEADAFEPSDERIDLNALAASVMRILEPQARKGHVALANRLGDECPPISADRRALKQILLNLVSNGIKFTRNGGTVTLSCGRDDDGGLFVCVADTGEGMCKEEIPVALQPFGRTDSAMTRASEGTGLGLPLSKLLIEAHGGELVIKSERNVGTEVFVKLPSWRVLALEEVANP